MNRLERARREIRECARRSTAASAERNPTAVMAVPEPGEPEILQHSIGSNGSTPAASFQETAIAVPMTVGDEVAIRDWLAHIEETDEAITAHVLNQCRTHAQARGNLLWQADEVPPA